MKLISNIGNDRVIDALRSCLDSIVTLSIASPSFSLFAFSELQELLRRIKNCRLLIPSDPHNDLSLQGADSDRIYRNRLQTRWLAKNCAEWLTTKVDVQHSPKASTQSALIAIGQDANQNLALTGDCAFTTDGLGVIPGNRFSLVHATENSAECTRIDSWFNEAWASLPPSSEPKQKLLAKLQEFTRQRSPALVYFLTLYYVFRDIAQEFDEDRIVKSATGIRDTIVWKKLFKFQRDGVIGAIDKLEQYGGCIIADSVGLGKTFEALAVIKYYELRNYRVLVLVPKRLRDNWTLYKANDRRNFLAPDRFNYDVLNHTDLSRSNGLSGDIDLSFINWGNYDLVVIDESHNFRNKATHKEHETRYDRLMRRIIKEGVKTRVLMLSATPVNNRLADLKNQIAFITEADDRALSTHGITSIEMTIRQAQLQFNRWLDLEDHEREPARLVEMLGFDYFKLLDLLTIARSRKHIEKYYGISETGRFSERLKPINIKPDVDLSGEFRSIREINNEIRKLTLAAYAPLRYILPSKQAAYDEKYSIYVRNGMSIFRQADREESLVHLMRVNVLKRLESSVSSFALTLQRQLHDVEELLRKIEAHEDTVDEIDIDDVDVDDPAFESLLVGRKVKVLLKDVDIIRWRQDLNEDRDRFVKLLSVASLIDSARDAKLRALREILERKQHHQFNPGNRKALVFTAFADTAHYLYENLAPWALQRLGIHSALVTGAGPNQTTLPAIRKDLGNILTAFAPRAKERPAEFAEEGEIDLLIATDCISEGQNLQDCDTVINYDIHWNPVRIIQRFGRIDRIGSQNQTVQLINFWPNMELEEYINLEQRVSGRMVLLDISATGEENVIEHQSGNQMNDLEYRRRQLIKLQDTVIDLDDLSSGIAITDLTLNDFRMDLAAFLKDNPAQFDSIPYGTFAVTSAQTGQDSDFVPGVIFCLRAVSDSASKAIESNYPLLPSK